MNEHEKFLFDLQGFLVVEEALSAEQVAALNSLVDRSLAQEGATEENTKRFSPAPWGTEHLDLLDNPRITPYLAELLGERFRLDHAYVDVIKSGLGPIGATLHGGATPYDPAQYYHFHGGRMYNGLTVVAYNLKDVNPGDGGFGCIPGSHKSNFPFPNDWRNLETPPPGLTVATGKAGSAVIFTEALTHGTMPWRGTDQRRTVFLKYSPHHMAWSRRYDTGEQYEGRTESQQRVLRTPGVYPK